MRADVGVSENLMEVYHGRISQETEGGVQGEYVETFSKDMFEFVEALLRW